MKPGRRRRRGGRGKLVDPVADPLRSLASRTWAQDFQVGRGPLQHSVEDGPVAAHLLDEQLPESGTLTEIGKRFYNKALIAF